MDRFIVTFLLIIVLPWTAAAQSEDAKAEGLRKFDEGRALYKEGKYLEALERTKEAYSIHPNSLLLYNIALCHDKLERAQEAVQSYRKYLEEDPASPVRAKVEARLKALTAKLQGEIAVSSLPSGASVRIDGKDAGVTPCSIEAPPGRHEIALTKEGFTASTIVLEVRGGERVAFSPRLTEEHSTEVVIQPPERDWMPSPWAWAAMGTGVATVVAGGILGGMAFVQKGDADRLLEQAQVEADLVGAEGAKDGAQSKALAANVLYGVGAALVATGVLVWFLSPQRAEEAPKIGLTVGPTGVLALGRF